MNRLTNEQEDKAKRLASGLPPFTITINDPKDATTLVSAFMYCIGGGREGGELMASTLGLVCKHMGVEQGVDTWMKAAMESGRGKNLPAFYKPLLIHYFTHIVEQNEKEKE